MRNNTILRAYLKDLRFIKILPVRRINEEISVFTILNFIQVKKAKILMLIIWNLYFVDKILLYFDLMAPA